MKKAGKDAIDLIKEFEGFSPTPYVCPGGVLTIGYGHTQSVNKDTARIDEQRAEELLRYDVLDAEVAINSFVKVELNQKQFDALVSFVFNLGAGNFRKSTLLKRINAGEFDEVPAQLMRWNRAGKHILKGLTRRRAAEAELWATPSADDILPPEPVVRGDNIKRDVPTVINKENVAAVAAVGGAVASSNLEANNPISWAIAIIAVAAAAVFLYLFLRRRGK